MTAPRPDPLPFDGPPASAPLEGGPPPGPATPPPPPAAEPPAFDPTRAVPEGVSVLEASAGTGKTHTVASLVVTEVARGRPLDEVLVVTFTRKATATLRERIWRRLGEASAALAPGAEPPPGPTDPVVVALLDGTPDEVAERRRRLDDARADFDAATITTTHGFCQQVLAGLGVAGDSEPDLQLVDDIAELVRDAVDDLFVRRFHTGGDPLFDHATAADIADAVVRHPDAEIGAVDAGSEAAKLRRRFAVTLRERIAEQKRRARLVTYDDLLARLDGSLGDAAQGPAVVERLRPRFTLVIVDEFQDTDRVQWRILRAAFGDPPSRLVLVGDPKQAVYAFRGGDVHAYLEATAGAACWGLDVSWRADGPLLAALDVLFCGADPHAAPPDLGLGITYRRLRPRPGAEVPRLVGPVPRTPLTVRVVDKPAGGSWSPPRQRVARDVAAEAVRWLDAGHEVLERDLAGRPLGAPRPLVPADLAVLVRTNRQAEQFRDALVAAGVPAVTTGGQGVLLSDAPEAWRRLLDLLAEPGRQALQRWVALGPFVGWSPRDLAEADDAGWDALDDLAHGWAAALRTGGVARLWRRIEASDGFVERLLGGADGERALTDLRHLADLLATAVEGDERSPSALARWIADQQAAARHAEAEATRRRLHVDADAVTVQTVHGAKGLEYGVVLLPTVWEAPWPRTEQFPVFHDTDGTRRLGVGGEGDVHRWQQARAAEARDQEDLRLLYVAATRARHAVVVWCSDEKDAACSALARVVLGRDPATGAVPAQVRGRVTPTDAEAAFAAMAAACTAVSVERVDPVAEAAVRRGVGGGEPGPFAVARFDRTLDRTWVRTSYSALTAPAHEAAPVGPLAWAGDGPAAAEVGSEAAPAGESGVTVLPEVDVRTVADEPAVGVAGADQPSGALVPLADVPGGARVGTLVHEVFEHVDFAAADLRRELAAAAHRHGADRLLPDHVDALVDGLDAALHTPLGPAFGGTALAGLSRSHRLDELAFDLPLAGGDGRGAATAPASAGPLTMDAVAAVFATLPAGDPVAGYHERLADPVLATSVRGFLTGSIDLVARVEAPAHGRGGAHRFVVVDYKTNRLAPVGEPLTVDHYHPDLLATAMADAHYPLQAALYLVALHRYLRWRLAGYDQAVHLGGAAYLFVRGMVGPDAPHAGDQPHGVFTWQPPAEFVVALSDLLDRGAA